MHGPIVEYLESHLTGEPPYSFLDYGFGSGSFLRKVAARSHSAYGADISSQNVEQLAERCRMEGRAIDTVDLSTSHLDQLGRDHFDVITLFQVIEHLLDPLDVLRELSGFQREGGLLYIECPNDRSAVSAVKTLVQRFFRRRSMWRSMKYPEHLHGFNPKALTTLLQSGGYDVVACGDYAYCDGIHQVESRFWWPPFRENTGWYTPYGFSRSLIPLVDGVMSKACGAGSGLYALARKASPTRPPTR
jgi:SAM-dependent methyltransferase